MYKSDNAPTSILNVTGYLTPDAARILVTACEELQKVGLKPSLSLSLLPKPEAEATVEAIRSIE